MGLNSDGQTQMHDWQRGGGSGPSFFPPSLPLQSHRPTPPYQPSVSQFKEGFHAVHLCVSSCFIRFVWHWLVSQKAVSSWRAGAVSFMSSLAPSPALNSLVAVVGPDECNCSATFLWHYGDKHSGSHCSSSPFCSRSGLRRDCITLSSRLRSGH